MNNQFMNVPIKKAVYASSVVQTGGENPQAGTECSNNQGANNQHANSQHGNGQHANSQHANNQYANNQHANNQYANNQHPNNQYTNSQHGHNQFGHNHFANAPHPNAPHPNAPNLNYNFPYPNMHNYQHQYPMGPPQQQMHMFTNDWKSILAPLKSCRIKQQFDDREFLADFAMGMKLDFNNRYLVLDAATELLKFTAIESSDCFNRNCLPKMCIPINMKILTYGKELSRPDIIVEKDCSCTILCLNRPTIRMYEFSNNNNKELIGTIKSPFSCCSYKFDLYDSAKRKIIYMDDTCCQLSILCPCPFGPFKFSNFFLRDAKTKQKVAHLQKEVPFLKFVKRDMDNYTLNFEEVQNPEWKMMLLAFSLFMDYIYYDKK
ncbi:hypothetical protein C922_03453 [Plasmodium inui San Antonio 1]|uniref:Phospholipid scramblase n=1 Tax=Plasmodium inui San Antonio 1 TaxID=1237626 RepID=W7A4N1_9APIC|nr:hypothetical protein C922_03453 [Plasmodium inui San Antonio 1]EUD66258.1 hypothetical protein C922_03453 [Plasmodium inui San Antonio 1]